MVTNGYLIDVLPTFLKYLILCSAWTLILVWNNKRVSRIFILGWTVPLRFMIRRVVLHICFSTVTCIQPFPSLTILYCKLQLNRLLTVSQTTERQRHHSVPYRCVLLSSNSKHEWLGLEIALSDRSPSFSFCQTQQCNELWRPACLYCLIAPADACLEDEQSAIYFSSKRLE